MGERLRNTGKERKKITRFISRGREGDTEEKGAVREIRDRCSGHGERGHQVLTHGGPRMNEGGIGSKRG